MYWQSKQVSSPHIEALLNREDCTVYDLMDDEDILQECKSQNKKLLEFLTRPNVLDELITLMTQTPEPDTLESQHRFKYPHIACEILSCDIPLLNEKLAGMRVNIAKRNLSQLEFWLQVWKEHRIKMWCKQGDTGLLQKLYSFINTEEPLNPLLASFFSKAMGILLIRSKDQNWFSYQFTCLQVFAFLKNQENFIHLLLHHLETSAIMNVVLKLVTEIEGLEMRQNILNWLESQELVPRLVKLLSPTSQPSRHSNAAELLCDMIHGVRDISQNFSERSVESDPILCSLESDYTTTLILDTILGEEKLESSIVGGIQVLLALLKPKTNGNLNDQNRTLYEAADNEMKLRISSRTIPYFEKFHDLLQNPPYMPPVKTTVETLQVPVGNTRLSVLKLFATLLSVGNVKVRTRMIELNIFDTFLNLFFKYPWNNFLHSQVQYALGEALASLDNECDQSYYEYIFVKCRLIDRILDVKNSKAGYKGHLIEIAQDIVSQSEKNNILDTFITQNLPLEVKERWETFVTEELVSIKATQETLSAPIHMADNGDNNGDYTCSQDVYEQQVQRSEPQYIEIYDCRNDVYKDDEEPILFNNSGDQSSSVMLNAEEQAKSEEMFNRLCEIREKPDDDNWWSNDVTMKFTRKSSSSDEEEEEGAEEEGERDTLNLWKSIPYPWSSLNPQPDADDSAWANLATAWPGDPGAATTIDQPVQNVNDANWACFDNFDSALNFSTEDSPPESEPMLQQHIEQAFEELPQQQVDQPFEELPQQQIEQPFKEVPQQIEQPVEELPQHQSEGATTNESEEKEQVVVQMEEQHVLNAEQNVSLHLTENVTQVEQKVVKTSDDDNANPIVMIENRTSEVTEEKKVDENEQKSVEIVNSSSDNSPVENVPAKDAESDNKST